MQQLRDAIPSDQGYRFLMHDRDAIFSQELDWRVCHLGLRVLKSRFGGEPLLAGGNGYCGFDCNRSNASCAVLRTSSFSSRKACCSP
jgi:hypothetical protein